MSRLIPKAGLGLKTGHFFAIVLGCMAVVPSMAASFHWSDIYYNEYHDDLQYATYEPKKFLFDDLSAPARNSVPRNSAIEITCELKPSARDIQLNQFVREKLEDFCRRKQNSAISSCTDELRDEYEQQMPSEYRYKKFVFDNDGYAPLVLQNISSGCDVYQVNANNTKERLLSKYWELLSWFIGAPNEDADLKQNFKNRQIIRATIKGRRDRHGDEIINQIMSRSEFMASDCTTDDGGDILTDRQGCEGWNPIVWNETSYSRDEVEENSVLLWSPRGEVSVASASRVYYGPRLKSGGGGQLVN